MYYSSTNHPDIFHVFYNSLKIKWIVKKYKKSPRTLQKIISLGILVVVFFTGSGLLYLFGPWAKKSDAAWFNDNWAYRKSIAISAHTSSESNVYLNLTGADDLDTSDTSRFQTDCGDLRFTKYNGEVLPYYIVSGCGTSSTVVHVNFDSFPSGAQTIYFYYGNPSAVNGFSASDFNTAASGVTIGSQGSEEQAPSPIAYWKLDEGTGTSAYDSSQNAYTATLANMDSAPSTRSGWMSENMCVSGKCVKFPGGTSGSITVGSSVAGVKTVSFWVRPASSSAALINLNSNDISITASSGTISANNFTTPVIYVNGAQSNTLTANTWQYITVVTGTAVTASGIKIGNVKGDYLNGFIDDVKLYSFVRSAAQILADYNSVGAALRKGSVTTLGASTQNIPNVLSNKLLGYWKMDESGWAGTAGEVADSSGNANNGTAQASATTTTGKFGNGGSFNGSNKFISVSNTISNIQTIAFWAKATSNTSYLIQLASGVEINVSSGVVNTTGISNSIIYVNGVKDGIFTANLWNHILISTDTSITANSIQFAKTSGGFLNGVLDEVRVYSRILGGYEAQIIYNWAPGPVGYWDFEDGGGSSAKDVSGNGNNGTWQGSLGNQWTEGKYGGAGNFNGTNNYVDAGNAASLQITGPITLEAWVYQTANVNYPQIVEKTSGGDHGYYLRVNGDGVGNNYVFMLDPGGSSQLLTGGSNVLNRWVHVAGTYDGSTMILYIDGVKVNSTNISGTSTNASPNTLHIGANSDGNSSLVNGKVDEVKIYNYARTPLQVLEDMNANHPASGSPDKTAVGYWKLDEGSGNVSTSSASYAGTKQLLGMYNMADPSTAVSGWNLKGKFNKALGFDGNNDYAAVTGNPTDFQITSNLTLSAWIKLSTNNANHAIIAKNAGAGARGYRLYTDTNGKLNLEVSSNGTTTFSITGNTTLANEVWYHVAGVASAGASLTVYVNGKQDGINTTSVATAINNTSANLTIGAENGGSTSLMQGFIDEVKIYQGAFSSQDVAIDYNRGSSLVLGTTSIASDSASRQYCIPGDTSPSCISPVGEWLFEEALGSVVRDTSASGNPGSITSGTGGYVNGKIGKGYKFDAADTSINVGSATTLDNLPAAGMSIEAWIYPKSMGESSLGFIIAKNSGTTPSAGWILRFANTNAITFTVDRGGGTDLTRTTSNNVINLNQWNHVALSWSGTLTASTVQIYVNGGPVSYATTTNGSGARVDDGASNFYIGNDSTSARTFDGIIDHVRVFNYQRSASQLAWTYNYGRPVGWWKMDDCQGTTLYDSSGNSGQNITMTIGASGTYTAAGTCTDGSAASAWYAGRNGKRNYAIGLDGTNDHGVSGTVPKLSITSMTISAWVYIPTSIPAGWKAIVVHNANGNNWYSLYKSSNANTFEFRWSQNGTSSSDFTSTIVADTWYHVVGTYDSTATIAKMYLNGKLDKTVTGAGAPSAVDSTIRIGSKDGTQEYFQGLIDDVQIYSYPMTEDQVKALYTDGVVRFGPVTGAP